MHINIPTPSVPSPLQLQVGSTYRNRAGELVRITGTNSTTWPFSDNHDRTYLPSGASWSDYLPCHDDLIELVSDTKADDTKPANDAESKIEAETPITQLQVGSTYRSRGGELVRITRKLESPVWPYVCDNNYTYDDRGRYWDNRTNDFRDLVALVSDAKAEEANDADDVAADAAAEAPPLQLEVGATYRNRIGEVVRISDAPKPAELPTSDADDAGTWITDRLPAAEDGDYIGNIELRDPPVFGPWPYHLRLAVIPGEVWRRTKWHPSRSNTTAPTPSTAAPLTAPLNPFASIRRTILADGTHILDAIDTAGNAWHRIIGATSLPWELTTPLPKLPRS